MPRLYSQRIMLREYRKEDLKYMREWVNDPDVVDNLSDIFLCPHTFESTENFLETLLSKQSMDKIGFVIADKNTEEYIGQLDLMNIDWKNRITEMGIVIGNSKNRGKGYGSEGIRLLQEFVFNRLNLNKLELKVHDYNTRAIKCYLKCGFIEEGRLRQRFYINGKYTDYIMMGILKSEFEKRK